jgi:tRNA uridine 5-carboxymethylaminomethyl modification enzyme
MKQNYDVIVVGGGHAGVEAAHIASKMGSKTLLITLDSHKVATMPCNPSIGGLGKGHIVFEISALGGLMPQLCTKTYLQARMLNTSKGPAVQGLRLQIDKFAYSKAAIEYLSNTPKLDIFQGAAIEILTDIVDGKKDVSGVRVASGEVFTTGCAIVTAGTFLNGVIHMGKTRYRAGQRGQEAVSGLSESISQSINAPILRLKTGTPPRILTSSIDFSKLERQPAQKLDYLYEFDELNVEEKYPCFIAKTNQTTHEIIRKNMHLSALYGGSISGIGPRYCPSIEDKIRKFPHQPSHHVFIEPEDSDGFESYPAGVSTSLPLEVQQQYIKSIVGLENAVITKSAYAIEYDFFQPNNLKHSLETKNVQGLFLAGQVIGTTGYEEAAGLGLIAGINASLKCKGQDPLILSRSESYIGVMIDDLITLGVDEPYRMFTSRAERRLILRQDNTFLRLMPYAKKLATVSDQLYNQFLKEKEIIEKSIEIIKKSENNELFKLFHAIDFTEQVKTECRMKLEEKLKQREILNPAYALPWLRRGRQVQDDPSIRFVTQITQDERAADPAHGECARSACIEPWRERHTLSSRAILCIHAEIRYCGYIEKENKEAEKMIKFAELKIPGSVVYKDMPGLTREIQQKLIKFKPETIAQAQLIPGMTPAAISILIFQARLFQTRLVGKSYGQ